MGVPNSLRGWFLLLPLLLIVRVSNAHDQFIDVISKSKSAVVILEVSRKKSKQSKKKIKKELGSLGDSLQFFEDELSQIPPKSRGSGFIVKYEGDKKRVYTILTAAHVVKGAGRIKVLFANGAREDADVVLLDKKKDIAVLSVVSFKAPKNYLRLSVNEVVEGQSVLAIAGSFDLSVSSSLGIVSAVGVELASKKGLKLIQTDAAINPGSSGGPLFDSKGNVVAVISNIYTKTGTFSGAAFAVPAMIVSTLIDDRMKSDINPGE